MDEIYTRIKKEEIADLYGLLILEDEVKLLHIASGKEEIELYNKAKQVVGNIEHIYTDGNSCYHEAFTDYGVKEPHTIALGKSQTHLIESFNSSMRDNLARFNRRSKRYSKTLEMLDNTLPLFFNKHIISIK